MIQELAGRVPTWHDNLRLIDSTLLATSRWISLDAPMAVQINGVEGGAPRS
ncbi:hypothetical protein ACFU7T_01905 [Streptomyces sp. NPDC057555]|uniref:hypothetical protein n=1 Tax=Streptomyces sp. NPDC057555 TaxID=3346166 RepID=UPI003688659B